MAARDLRVVSLPSWHFRCLRKWFGPDEAPVAWPSCPHGVTRTRSGQPSAADPASLAREIAAEPGRYCPEALSLALQGHSVIRLPGWADGRFSVQDEAAMLVGYAANPKPGWTIVDLCSAPGGKACHLAERTGDAARIVAADLHAGRLQLVRDQADRLGLSSVTTRQPTRRPVGTDREEKPLPTSPDRRTWSSPTCLFRPGPFGAQTGNPSAHDLRADAGFLPLQAAILDTADKLLKPGGVWFTAPAR
jgi:16S rRNA (cytosine967-C5)-methyltransferase